MKDQYSQKTLVIPVNFDMNKKVVKPRFVSPIYPESKNIFNVISKDNDAYSETLVLECKSPVEVVKKFYDKELTKKGWKKESIPTKLKTLEKDNTFYSRGKDETWLTISNGENYSSSYVNLVSNIN